MSLSSEAITTFYDSKVKVWQALLINHEIGHVVEALIQSNIQNKDDNINK